MSHMNHTAFSIGVRLKRLNVGCMVHSCYLQFGSTQADIETFIQDTDSSKKSNKEQENISHNFPAPPVNFSRSNRTSSETREASVKLLLMQLWLPGLASVSVIDRGKSVCRSFYPDSTDSFAHAAGFWTQMNVASLGFNVHRLCF